MIRTAQVAGVVALGAALALPASASAASSIVGVNFGAPKAEIATTVSARTILDVSSSRLYVKTRATGGPACAPTASTDPGNGLSGFYSASISTGDRSTSSVVTFSAPGTYQWCAWLSDRSDETPRATATGTFTVASPSGAITGVQAPNPAPVGQNFLVTITGQTEVTRRLYTALRPAGGPACGASIPLEPSDSGVTYQGEVLGAFSKQVQYKQDAAGTYRLCSWITSDRSDTSPVGVNETLLTVGAPPPPPPPPSTTKATRTTLTLWPKRRVGQDLLLSAKVGSAFGRPTGRCAFDRGRSGRWVQTAVVRLSAGNPCRTFMRLDKRGGTAFRVRFLPDPGWAASTATSPRIIVLPRARRR